MFLLNRQSGYVWGRGLKSPLFLPRKKTIDSILQKNYINTMKFLRKPDVKKYIHAAGGRKFVANILNVKVGTVSAWCDRKRIPVHHQINLEMYFSKNGIELNINPKK